MANIQKLGNSITISESRVIPLLLEGDLVLYCTVKITTTNEEWQNKMFVVLEDTDDEYAQLCFSNGVAYHMLRVCPNTTNKISIVIDGIYIPLERLQYVIPLIETVIIPNRDTKKVTIPIKNDMQDCSVTYNGTTTTLVTQVERTSTYLCFERQDNGSCCIVQLTRGTDIVAHYHVHFLATETSKPPLFVITQRTNANTQLTNPLRTPLYSIQQPQSQFHQQQSAFDVEHVKKTLLAEYLDLFVQHDDILYPVHHIVTSCIRNVPIPLNAFNCTPIDVKITKNTPLYLSFSNNVTVIVSKHADESRIQRCAGLLTYLFPQDNHKREIALQEEPAPKKQK